MSLKVSSYQKSVKHCRQLVNKVVVLRFFMCLRVVQQHRNYVCTMPFFLLHMPDRQWATADLLLIMHVHLVKAVEQPALLQINRTALVLLQAVPCVVNSSSLWKSLHFGIALIIESDLILGQPIAPGAVSCTM